MTLGWLRVVVYQTPRWHLDPRWINWPIVNPLCGIYHYHDMISLSALLAFYEGNPHVPDAFPDKVPMIWSFHIFLFCKYVAKQTEKLPKIWDTTTLMWHHSSSLIYLASELSVDDVTYLFCFVGYLTAHCSYSDSIFIIHSSPRYS